MRSHGEPNAEQQLNGTQLQSDLRRTFDGIHDGVRHALPATRVQRENPGWNRLSPGGLHEQSEESHSPAGSVLQRYSGKSAHDSKRFPPQSKDQNSQYMLLGYMDAGASLYHPRRSPAPPPRHSSCFNNPFRSFQLVIG